ncbi:GAF domain-containing protein [Gloeocapsopsis dulcis]|uniref:GAF domain-containing protein n=1 Tax=Gloeocapsopsis dulcis AAB1 = 1H9 TaxID=1433147 RepID=A0A6N8FZZ4_9CHRO|nr:GAF domain-containing protein [Gloeocapsopsis dulcis]MUL38710.1 GAF domain-containing protein [Gloeocapsopsis dulcis AAB1 = 1H9]WNN88872.1 GAF domain-containing protein [Gloeocapsopsis dulcis]
MQLPEALENVFASHSEPDAIFHALLPALCNVLQTDRCFLYLRNPYNKNGKVAYCWQRSAEIPAVTDSEWSEEPKSLAAEDPLFSAALQAKPSVYVEDVETANPEVVNLGFERKHFGHRALIHAHLCQDNLLWGILQPCIFGKPRVWSESDRAIVTELEQRLTPLAITYVKTVGI